ncbi:SRPBCC family protein [Williamsia deligens]|uniref:SRPBCC family protein n=1 Tax=Williamsia deligens TaxID=321325 RepID=A0ABW3G6A2_9NOCA|nr:SRPBCC family protein [Williamsia deligens]MCP2193581.1 Polyketide cyclase / dehydrase and lipid transport [Williamsia deligens]
MVAVHSHSDSVVVAADPNTVYDVVADVTRTGEWSPICEACWWDAGDEPGPDGPRVGAWFTGRNVTPDRTWETRSLVVAADRGREFAWLVWGKYARWGYTLRATDGGTELTESWQFLDEGIEYFHGKYGDEAQAQIQNRIDAAHSGIPATLARVKDSVEGS